MTSKYCSALDYLGPHQILLDHVNGCNICTACARVLDEGLSYAELHLKTVPEQRAASDVQSIATVDGDSAVEYLNKVGSRLHLCQSTINNTFDNYLKTKAKMQKIMTFGHQHKNKRMLLNDKNLIVYLNTKIYLFSRFLYFLLFFLRCLFSFRFLFLWFHF